MNKKMLYSFWGYLSNRYGISAPDGNASYSPWIINSFLDHGYEVFGGPIDRDKPVVEKYGLDKAFSTFMPEARKRAYTNMKFTNLNDLPDLDLLLIEWRFETIYNVLDKDDPAYCPDLDIQKALMDRYYGKTKIVVLDTDTHFTDEDRKKYPDVKVIKQEEVSLGAPIEALKPELTSDLNKIFSYVGNEYKKMIDISKKIDFVSNKYRGLVHFYGNWTREDKRPFREAYPNIVYHDRIGIGEFKEAMQDSLFVPLLATETYRKEGSMTFRLAESLMFGSIPIGFSDFKDIDKFLPEFLIVDMKNYERDIVNLIDTWLDCSLEERTQLRDLAADKVARVFSNERLYEEIVR